MTNNPFEVNDIWGNLIGRNAPRPEPERKPLPPIRGKEIDGVLYVNAADVALALEQQAPTVNRRLIDKLRRKP